jgi:hypothetical protein
MGLLLLRLLWSLRLRVECGVEAPTESYSHSMQLWRWLPLCLLLLLMFL